MSKLIIGDLEIPSNVVLAPMAGVSDRAFKEIINETGDYLVFTEMVNDKALINNNKRTIEMIKPPSNEKYVAYQIFGSEPETIAKAAQIIERDTNACLIDINMGCPAPKIVKNYSGSKILTDSKLVYEITKAVVEAVSLPVSVKIRIGYNDQITAVENAKLIEKAGAKLISVHGRTTKQMYSGEADWEVIKSVKKAVKIPVLGNGDINTPEVAYEKLHKSGVDGVMIGRAAMGNPWIIKETSDYFESGSYHQISVSEKKKVMIEHCEKLIKYKNEKVAILEMRGHAAWYVKGMKHANSYKRSFQVVKTFEEFKEVVDTINEE